MIALIQSVAPIQVAVSSSGGGGSGSNPDFVEDFSEYANITQFRNNSFSKFSAKIDGSSDGNETSNALLITLDSGSGLNINGFNLTQCMLYSYPIVNASDYTIGLNIALPTDQGEMWCEMYAMFSSNFATSGPAPGNPDFKFNAARVHTTGADRFMTFCGTNEGNTAGYPGGWQFGYPGNDQGANSDVPGVYGNSDYTFGTGPIVWDGTWHRYRYHLKANSTVGGAVFYVDSFKMPGFPIGSVDTTHGGAAGNIYGWALGRNMNKGTSVAMTLRWGRYAAWFGGNDPGWGF